jgi:predicted  nucleic acid-binding Zn-ribbon protein
MSDSRTYGEVTVSSDGVGVTKRFEEDEFPVPAIAFEFVSEREEAVTVRITDEVPEDIQVEDLGFHPEYGSEYWTIDEDEIVFEREFESESEYTTVYGIRATGADNIEQFLTQPTIEEVDPPLPEGEDDDFPDDVVPESDDAIVKDVISGDDSVSDTAEEDDEDVETLDLKDPMEPGESDPVGTDGETATGEGTDGGTDGEIEIDPAVEPDSGAEPTAPAEGGDLIGRLADQLESEEVPEEDLRRIEDALDAVREDDEPDGVTEARLGKLQSDIADLRAYTDALEEFLADNGTGEQLIADFEDRLETFSTELDRIDDRLQANDETVESVETDLGAIREDVSAFESTVADLETSIEDIEDSIGEFDERLPEEDLTDRLDDLEAAVDDLRTWQDQIRETFSA